MSSIFFDILFNKGELICLSKHAFGVKLTDSRNYVGFNFVSINPMKDSRKDDNVTVFRNILCEFDSGTLDEQMHTIQSSGMPLSTLVYSGNKSYHAIVSLQQPVEDRVKYDRLVEAVYSKLPTVDTTGRNPSRFSRVPDVTRDNGKYQSLVMAKGRVPNEVLYNWLGVSEETLNVKVDKVQHFLKGQKLVPVRVESFLTYGAPEGLWNVKLFESSCEMARAGFSAEEVESRVFSINNRLDKSDRRTIKSAYDTVRREG